ncbi:PREDICTED: protein broad-minded-like [Ceratosolen solmsi marchali]|uniref:Protein broad-minded-like n=1 Tax=Ceratosolen solmsi marchali TaxID=326594 RepID=A0AAJ7DW04_9HYME|nr:PREDICTED: protein broad-minded-like [Ceratosolen solmsi marchali]
MKKYLNDKFSNIIDDSLDSETSPIDVAQKIINSNEITLLRNSIKSSFIEQIEASRETTRRNSPLNSTLNSISNSPPQTSLSYISDLSGDDWSLKENTDEIEQIINQMCCNKPDHVRLAGYEVLLENELANITVSNSWEALLQTLKDGLIDDSRSIFEASLLLHSKLLNCPNFHCVFMNLLNAFTEQYYSKKMFDTLPTILSGVNFKIFLHEKLFRLMKLILDQQEEFLKGMRINDKAIDDMIDHFVSFLCSRSATNATQLKPLNTLQIVSVIEPQASWSKKWMYSLITRKILCTAISKSPDLIKSAIEHVKRGFDNPPTGISVTISDEQSDVFISGDSVETLTFLHCLNLLAHLCSYSTGRDLLLDVQTDDSFCIPDFLKALLDFLNILASSEASNSIYETVRTALCELLRKPVVLYDARFYQVALSPLVQTEVKMWPHTLDILNHMLDTSDGPTFLTTEYRACSSPLKKKNSANYPITIILTYASSLLRQPISVINVEHITDLLKFVGKLFNISDVFSIIRGIVKEHFYPSVSYMYSKLDRYYIENERKTQHLDRSIKEMLLNLLSLPLGLQMLSNEPLIIKELIRGSISSVRTLWSDFNVIGFISNSGFLTCGIETLFDLSSHVLTTLFIDLTSILEDPHLFYDPWENANIKVFLHVLALFSLNTNCFMVFMRSDNGNKEEKENKHPSNLYEFFQNIINVDSSYHHLGLLTLKNILWNLDIYIYLLSLLDFQNKFLEFQDYEICTNEDNQEQNSAYIIDENSSLRHTILLNCYFIDHKLKTYQSSPEKFCLFSKLPPPEGIDELVSQKYSQSELMNWLQESKSALKDNNWILQTQKAHKASANPIENLVFLDLLDQMEQTMSIVEGLDQFKWNLNLQYNDSYWFPEEECGINLVLHYGLINGLLQNNEQIEQNLKIFIYATHEFINYKKSTYFNGFDWFLATVFLICGGNIEKSKIFVSQMLRFPTTTFIWFNLAQVIDENNHQEASTKLLFAHLLDNIISHEFPMTKFALKNECGLDWWMLCDRLMTQCFWGILPWNEIIHYFAICILHPPDYVIYYCASLLNYCESNIRNNIVKGKMCPEDMIFEDYRCHSQMGFMDRLGKTYGDKVLPLLMQRKINLEDNLK